MQELPRSSHGPVANRPGTGFVRGQDFGAQDTLIPFVFSRDQAFALEFGHESLRFHALGATLMSGSVPYELVPHTTRPTCSACATSRATTW